MLSWGDYRERESINKYNMIINIFSSSSFSFLNNITIFIAYNNIFLYIHHLLSLKKKDFF